MASANSNAKLIGSLELWAASKVIGRECAEVNSQYLVCKKKNGMRPSDCSEQGNLVEACSQTVIQKMTAKFPNEFKAFQRCLDQHDYSFQRCRDNETALLNCWNRETTAAAPGK